MANYDEWDSEESSLQSSMSDSDYDYNADYGYGFCYAESEDEYVENYRSDGFRFDERGRPKLSVRQANVEYRALTLKAEPITSGELAELSEESQPIVPVWYSQFLEAYPTCKLFHTLRLDQRRKISLLFDTLSVGVGRECMLQAFSLWQAYASLIRGQDRELGSESRSICIKPSSIGSTVVNGILDKNLLENWDELYGANKKGSNSFKVFYCEKGCMAYTGKLTNLTNCQVCGKPKDEEYFFSYYSIRPLLRLLMRNDHLAKMMFSDRSPNQGDSVSDFWNSELYEELRKREIVNHHSTKGRLTTGTNYFSTDTEFALALFTDTVGVSKDNETPGEYVAISLTILNIPVLAGRHRETQVFVPFTFFKAAGQPGLEQEGIFYNSFFTPLVDDLAEMGVGFSALDGRTKKEVNVRAHLALISGEYSAVNECLGFKDPTSDQPCRFCLAKKVHIDVDDAGPGGITLDSYDATGIEINDDVYNKHAGLNYKSIFVNNLGSLVMPYCAPTDYVQLITQNIPIWFIHILGAKYLAPSEIDESTYMCHRGVQSLLGLVVESLNNLPRKIGGRGFHNQLFDMPVTMKPTCWKTIGEVFPLFWWTSHMYGRTRHELTYSDNSKRILNYSEGNIEGNFEPSRSQQLVNLLTEMAVILRVTQLPTMKIADVKRINQIVRIFQKRMEEMVGTDSKWKLAVFDTPIHMLLHLEKTLLKCGMVKEYWNYPVEDAVQSFHHLAKSTKFVLPAVSFQLGLRCGFGLMYSQNALINFVLNTGTQLKLPRNIVLSARKPEYTALLVPVIKQHISSLNLEIPADLTTRQGLFLKPRYFRVYGEPNQETYTVGSIVKLWVGGKFRYGKCVEFVTYLPDKKTRSGEKTFVVVELFETYPMLMRSTLWSTEGEWINIGTLKKVQGKRERVAVNGTDLRSICHLLRTRDTTGQKSKEFQYIHDTCVLTTDELIRTATPEERSLIAGSQESQQFALEKGNPIVSYRLVDAFNK